MIEDEKTPEQMADELSEKLLDYFNKGVGTGGFGYLRILSHNVAELDGQFYPEYLRKIADEMDNLKRKSKGDCKT